MNPSDNSLAPGCYLSELRDDADALPTVFHITHWKAGSQWVHRILRAAAEERVVPPRLGEGQFLYDPIKSGGVYPTLYVTREQFRSVSVPSNARKFVVIRDLRDTLVSGYFSLRYSHALLNSTSASLRAQLEALSMEEGLLLLMERWLPSCAAIQASWIKSNERIVRYEDLLVRDAEILEDLLIDHCELAVDRTRLREIIEQHRFTRMSGGRAQGEENVGAHERKGTAGDWSEKFTPRVVRRFEDLYGALMKEVGYGRGASLSVDIPVRLTRAEVVEGYDVANALFSGIAPMVHWLAWEFAAFRHFPLHGRVLDIGCRDGGLFRRLFPAIEAADGVETSGQYVEAACANQAYRSVRLLDCFENLEVDGQYDCIFSSGAFNFVSDIERAIEAAFRALKPGGFISCSVATRNYMDWSPLPWLLHLGGQDQVAEVVRAEYEKVHHLIHATTADRWLGRFIDAGFVSVGVAPILPRYSAMICLGLDTLWHLDAARNVYGPRMPGVILSNVGFADAFRDIVGAAVELETDWRETAGLVLYLRKPAEELRPL